MNNFQSTMRKIQGLGSSHKGALTWLLQHLTAAIMLFFIPRGAYLFCKAIVISEHNKINLNNVINNLFDATILWILLFFGLTHGAMGCKLVIEDYIEPKWLCIMISLLMQIITFITVIIITVILFNFNKT